MTLPTAYYRDRDVTLYHGEALGLLRELPDESVDAVLTDPPYSSGGMMRNDRTMPLRRKYHESRRLLEFTGDNRDQHGFAYWVALWITEARRVLRDHEIVGVFTDWRQLAATIGAIQAGGLVYRGVVVWDKGEGARRYPGRFGNQAEYVVWGTRGGRNADGYEWALPGVFRHQAPTGVGRVHITQKPVGLMRDLVAVVPPGGTLLDPFAGSGTLLRAAKDLGRKAIGFELEVENCELVVARMGQGVLDLEGSS